MATRAHPRKNVDLNGLLAVLARSIWARIYPASLRFAFVVETLFTLKRVRTVVRWMPIFLRGIKLTEFDWLSLLFVLPLLLLGHLGLLFRSYLVKSRSRKFSGSDGSDGSGGCSGRSGGGRGRGKRGRCGNQRSRLGLTRGADNSGKIGRASCRERV